MNDLIHRRGKAQGMRKSEIDKVSRYLSGKQSGRRYDALSDSG